jgi:outer membrane protein TolC
LDVASFFVTKINCPSLQKAAKFPTMSITARIHQGTITLPPELNLPDGTEVEIVIPTVAPRNGSNAGPVRLPVFNGGGLQGGVNLEDRRADAPIA